MEKIDIGCQKMLATSFKPMKILLAGASGLIGKALVPALQQAGHTVVRLVRSKKAIPQDEIPWDPVRGLLDAPSLEGFDAVINLCGENIAAHRWNKEFKQQLYDSRIQSTRLLSEALAALKTPPRIWLNASAIGYYGNRGEEELTEESTNGVGFFPHVCRDWEQATQAAQNAGVRVVYLRFGMVLSMYGGALEKMLLPFKLGLGGVLGSGKQVISWITVEDAVEVIAFVLRHDELKGAVNVVSPHSVTNYEFTKALGKALQRPTVLPMPQFAVRLAFGDMADELLLASTKVKPAKLLQAGFTWKHPHLEFQGTGN